MYGFTNDIFISILRQVLTALGAFIVAKGYIGADQLSAVVGAIIVLVSTGFSVFFHASSNGAIATISTTSNASPNVETRTVMRSATGATETREAEPARVTTMVTSTNPEAPK